MRLHAGHLNMAARFSACMLAASPNSLLMPLPLTLALSSRFGREERLKRLHRMVPWARFCRRHLLGIDLSVSGRQRLPRPSRGHMYVANHQSYVDILVLMEALDTVAFLSKAPVKYIPFIGQCAYAGGTVFIQRRNGDSRQHALRETLRMCQQSTAVVVFPEGTRSTTNALRPRIHPGAIRAARDCGLKIVPVGLFGTTDVVPKTMDRVNTGQRVAVSIGRALDPAAYPDADGWVDAVWGAVAKHHARCRRQVAD